MEIALLTDKSVSLSSSTCPINAHGLRLPLGLRCLKPAYLESFERNRTLFELVEGLAEEHRATPSQIALAWMMNKRPWIVPIPGTRHLCRLKENIGAADIRLTAEQVQAVDDALAAMPMSEVFGGSPVKG